MVVELPVKMGRSRKKADLAIFLGDTAEHTQHNAYILVECKRSDASRREWEEAQEQLHAYMAGCRNAHFGMVVAGNRRTCYRSIKHPSGLYEMVETHDLPTASASRAHFTVVSPLEPVGPAEPRKAPPAPVPTPTRAPARNHWRVAFGGDRLPVPERHRRLGPSPRAPTPIKHVCAPCANQADFDRAMAMHTKCCPVRACEADAECPSGRVCCRIPDGQLCADAPRCAPTDRVPPQPPRPPRACELARWDGKARGLARLTDGQCGPGAERGYYLRVAFKQDEAPSHAAVAHAWEKYVSTYLGGAPCPNAREAMFFDRTKEAGAGISSRRSLLAGERSPRPSLAGCRSSTAAESPSRSPSASSQRTPRGCRTAGATHRMPAPLDDARALLLLCRVLYRARISVAPAASSPPEPLLRRSSRSASASRPLSLPQSVPARSEPPPTSPPSTPPQSASLVPQGRSRR